MDRDAARAIERNLDRLRLHEHARRAAATLVDAAGPLNDEVERVSGEADVTA